MIKHWSVYADLINDTRQWRISWGAPVTQKLLTDCAEAIGDLHTTTIELIDLLEKVGCTDDVNPEDKRRFYNAINEIKSTLGGKLT